MTKLTVAFQDAEETFITAYFAGPQDPAIYSFLGEVDDTDPRYLDFLARISPVVDPLTAAARERDRLLELAALRIAPLQDAVDLDDATDGEVALLKKWKQYRVAVNRVDLTAKKLSWPAPPAS